MNRPSAFHLLAPLCFIIVTTQAQIEPAPLLNIGDPAPALRVREWLKGDPVQQFEKGKVYIVELWATWCKPCKAAMPRLSALASQYKNKVTFIGIDVMELPNTPMEKVRAFVNAMGQKMDYVVAAEDSNFIADGWLKASGEVGIPKSFIINEEGRLAWIGHPAYLDKVLPAIVNKTWNLKEALAQKELNRRLKYLDREADYDLMNYDGNAYKKDFIGKPDSALIAIKDIITKEPKLKYTPLIAANTFAALLKTDMQKAYEYGKVAMVTETYEEPPCFLIVGAIEKYKEHLHLSKEIYQLDAEACQADIDQIYYPELANFPKRYNQMAAMYWRAQNKNKAVVFQQKAIEALKNKKDFSVTELAEFESRLQQYINM